MQEKRENSPEFIAEEMRGASRGSFPLSPGTMTGHYACARLYRYFRQDILSETTIRDIFDNPNPSPPALKLPHGHRDVSIDGLNVSVWKNFLETSFAQNIDVDPLNEIQSLISINADTDSENFFNRLEGKNHTLLGIHKKHQVYFGHLYMKADLLKEVHSFPGFLNT